MKASRPIGRICDQLIMDIVPVATARTATLLLCHFVGADDDPLLW